ncbi:hypothetical protein MsAg5_10250 [Methanosarcinaceae archaeon Ag5]|uniref:Uncharacterized protein n=1 Tax=Methanolapillus africanus TaxID=3028297 RepID=A0AAE4MJ91_9EURY|nr:hypothetical protein [Methanosarcinaceae archaeon Ag5]
MSLVKIKIDLHEEQGGITGACISFKAKEMTVEEAEKVEIGLGALVMSKFMVNEAKKQEAKRAKKGKKQDEDKQDVPTA